MKLCFDHVVSNNSWKHEGDNKGRFTNHYFSGALAKQTDCSDFLAFSILGMVINVSDKLILGYKQLLR